MYAVFVLCLLALASRIGGKLEIPSQEILLHDATVNPKTCGKFFHLTSERVKRIIGAHHLETLQDTYYDRCFVKCLFDLADFGEDGSLDKDKFFAVARAYGHNDTTLNQHFDNCKHFYYEGFQCEKFWQMFMCFHGLVQYSASATAAAR